MFKLISLKVDKFVIKLISWLYPFAEKGRSLVSWPAVVKVFGFFILYITSVLVIGNLGFDYIALSMVSPFSPYEKDNYWFFLSISFLSISFTTLSILIYFIPRFLLSKFSRPLIKSLIVTVSLSPIIFFFFIYWEVITGAVFALLYFISTMKYDSDIKTKYEDPHNDPTHKDYMTYNEK